jgi:outer membrane lipase/esterase
MLNPFARAARRSIFLTSRITAIALAAFLVASCGSDEADTPPLFSTTVVMGASLTDTGNVCPTAATPGCPPVPPYATGRFSNGALFVETIAGRYGSAVTPSTRGGNNFAYAGARTGSIPGLTTQSTTPSMLAQLQQFIDRPASAATLSPQTLFVVDASTFANNIVAGLPLILAATITPTQLITAGLTDVVTVMTRLYAAGARHIVVVNVPNVGLTPAFQAQGAQAQGAGTQIAGGFNQNLAAQMTVLAAASPGLKLYTIDLFTLSNTITANPGLAGLSNVTAPCVTTTAVCATPDTYLYWDSFHPTRAAGAYIAAQPTIPALPAP